MGERLVGCPRTTQKQIWVNLRFTESHMHTTFVNLHTTFIRITITFFLMCSPLIYTANSTIQGKLKIHNSGQKNLRVRLTLFTNPALMNKLCARFVLAKKALPTVKGDRMCDIEKER